MTSASTRPPQRSPEPGSAAWRERLAAGGTLILDGATGTELERRGIGSELPLWSAAALDQAPEAVAAIHSAYVAAGVDLLTANTFRTQRRSLARGGQGERAGELTRLAVSLARSSTATSDRSVAVLGSVAPLEDCFEPERVPDDSTLEREHAEHAENLATAGVDAVLIETMNTIREAVAAARAARAVELPFLVSFVCWQGARLLSGEDLSGGIEAVEALAPTAILVNCLPPSNVPACLDVLAGCGRAFGVYANLGAPLDRDDARRSEDCTPTEFKAHAAIWTARGARIVGGCCGTSPAHLEAVAQQLRSS